MLHRFKALMNLLENTIYISQGRPLVEELEQLSVVSSALPIPLSHSSSEEIFSRIYLLSPPVSSGTLRFLGSAFRLA